MTNRSVRYTVCIGSLLFFFDAISFAQDQEPADDADEEISMITVVARRVANTVPASTFGTAATLLRYDPQLDLQSRGLPEGQADISVRGGLFENSGFKLGAITIFDPQTGHYFADLPVDPDVLSSPDVLTGIDNAVHGFNSAVATINYHFSQIHDRREIVLGAGTDDLRLGSLHLGQVFREAGQSTTGIDVSYATAQGDGTIANGDHDFERLFARLQHYNAKSQTDLVLAYQDKFYGWPGAYTGFASLAETDHTKTRLFMVNHRRDYSDASWLEIGANYRRLVDDYDFDRTTTESGAPGSFDHETESYALGLQGNLEIGAWALRYGAQLTADELIRSTDLTEGRFRSRNYMTVSIVPTRRWQTGDNNAVTLRVGATADHSNRDGSVLLPLLGVSFEQIGARATHVYEIEFSSASQVPGYTVLNSPPSGLFGGNPDLGRERADTLSLAFRRETPASRLAATAFVREDERLVDWTFLSGAPFARQANAVDLDVFGVEILWTRQWTNVFWAAGYTWLDKDSDYGTAAVDASFYALNFARHRLTSGLIWHANDKLEFRTDVELRKQEANVLRSGGGEAFIASASLGWTPGAGRRFSLDLIVDNLTNSDFQEFPSTPGPGRQISLQSAYSW
jgi:outer membrane cobalamin receptor